MGTVAGNPDRITQWHDRSSVQSVMEVTVVVDEALMWLELSSRPYQHTYLGR